MKNEVKIYLENLKNKLINNKNKYQAYKKIGSKIIEIGVSDTKTDINKIVNNNLESIVSEKASYIIIIYYTFFLKDYIGGPLSLVCELSKINDKGKLSRKDELFTSISYTEDEIINRGIKKGDYKIVIKKLLNGEIESGIKKIYNADIL